MKDYEVGQIFEVTDARHFNYRVRNGDLLQLECTDGLFRVISGDYFGATQACAGFEEVRRVWPPENDKVKIVCEGKTVEISRESAKALNLI